MTQKRNNRVIVFESSLEGHRVRYIEHIVEAWRGHRDDLVVVLRDDARESREFQELLARHEPRVRFHFTIPAHGSRGWRSALQRLTALVAALRKIGPGDVIVPTADGLAQAMVLLHAWAWCGAVRESRLQVIMLRLHFGYKVRSVKDALAQMASGAALVCSPIARIWSIDCFSIQALRRVGPFFANERLRYLPDPIEAHRLCDPSEAKRLLNLPAKARVISCIGMLDERKGVWELVTAFKRVAGKDAVLLLAGLARGPLAQTLPAIVDDPAIVWFNRYFDESDMARYLSATDIMAVLYREHLGPSSMVLYAAQVGCQVIASEEGWIGRIVNERQLGWTCRVDDGPSIEAALAAALAAENVRSPAPAWLAAHDATAFAKALLTEQPLEPFRAI